MEVKIDSQFSSQTLNRKEEYNMARKGESIFYRKDGRYEARYIKGYSLDNKIVYGFVYGKSYSEAKKKRAILLLELNEQQKNKKKGNTFNTLIDSWLLQKKLTVKNSTYSRYIDIVENHIRPYLGNKNIDAINADIVSNFILSLIQNGNLITKQAMSNKTVKDIAVLLKQIFKFGNLNINVSYPKIHKKDIKILTLEERTRLETYIYSNMNNTTLGIILGLFMGLRIGEVCGLRWCDIDLIHKKLYVNHIIIRVKNFDKRDPVKTKVILDEPKTETSKRCIPIPNSIIPFIEKVKENNQQEDNFVLTNNRQFIETRSYYNRYKKIMDTLSIQNYNFHALRHTFATKCIELGFDSKTLSEILGHSDIKITLSLYVHPSDQLKNDHMNKLVLFKN